MLLANLMFLGLRLDSELLGSKLNWATKASEASEKSVLGAALLVLKASCPKELFRSKLA